VSLGDHDLVTSGASGDTLVPDIGFVIHSMGGADRGVQSAVPHEKYREYSAMALSPKERSDFDAIVTRLRMEDAGVGVIQPRRRSTLVLVSLIVTALVLGLVVALVENRPDAVGPVLVAVAMLGGMVAALRACVRAR
jgi:hypothetical protein